MNKKVGAALALFLPLLACGKPKHQACEHARKIFHTSSGHYYQQDDLGTWYLLYAISANGSPTPVVSASRIPPVGAYPVTSRAPSAKELEDAEETEEENGDEGSEENTEDSDGSSGTDDVGDAGGDAGGGGE